MYLDDKGEDEEEIKTTWCLPKSLLKQLKHFATDDDIKLAQLITKVLNGYAEHREAKK